MAKINQLESIKDELKTLRSHEAKLAHFMKIDDEGGEISYMQPSIMGNGEYGTQIRFYIRVDELYYSALLTLPSAKNVQKVLKKVCRKGFKFLEKNEDDIRIDFLDIKHPDELLTVHKRTLEDVCKENNKWR
ncbi:hypothetical protein ACE193_12205 [Bernardetia sp. OM2101]|uniref:hypothetical protein n=1 Tax=Bernardetia sp. OM2101 TaxID=3344876 RepID=UPI0035CFD863